jgi:hypothetical protein
MIGFKEFIRNVPFLVLTQAFQGNSEMDPPTERWDTGSNPSVV